MIWLWYKIIYFLDCQTLGCDCYQNTTLSISSQPRQGSLTQMALWSRTRSMKVGKLGSQVPYCQDAWTISRIRIVGKWHFFCWLTFHLGFAVYTLTFASMSLLWCTAYHSHANSLSACLGLSMLSWFPDADVLLHNKSLLVFERASMTCNLPKEWPCDLKHWS